jgi:hypothetical protein
MKLNVFGRDVEVIRRDDEWAVFYIGGEGKKRLANDIQIPEDINAAELLDYISDLCHEWATLKYPKVQLLSSQ